MQAIAPYSIAPDQIPVTFNVFMKVDVHGETGVLAVRPPRSKAGDYVDVVARMDLIVGMTACTAEQSIN